MNNNVANLFINGHTVGNINITSSIGQGDPFSVLAFNVGILPLTLDLMSTSKNNSFKIKSPTFPKYPMPSFDKEASYEVPLLSYADDNISLPESLDHIPPLLMVYKDFQGLSNLKINLSKTVLAANRKLTISEIRLVIEMGFQYDKITTEISFLGHNINLNRCFDTNVDKSILIDDISERLNKTCTFMNKFHFSEHAKEIIVNTYINSVCTYRMLPFTFNKTQLIKPQKLMDAFVVGNSSYTKGNQRYLPSKLGGVGCIHLYSHAKASSQFWLKKLFF